MANKSEYTMFGKRVKKRLIDKNMTATELADSLGTTPQYLNKILHGERSGEKYMNAIAEILNLDMNAEFCSMASKTKS